MTTAPFVELGFHPTDLRPRDLPRVGAFLGSPADALEAALAVARATMVAQVKAEVRGIAEPSHAQLLRIADLAWQSAFWKFRKVSAPIIADAYLHAYRRAEAGDVPMSVVYDLADKHAEKIGDYFHTSSRQALSEGFNTLVNRQVPAKEAAGTVLDAYGLSPRQMRTYAASKFRTPISDVLPRTLKARARAYVDKAFTTRTKKLARQEEHNIDQQAQQFAWMWLQDKGRLSEKAQKIWITAHDERVCPVCGPLHGKKVGVNDQFHTAQGSFWTPGLHPNCRCVVRLLEHRFSKADWDPQEHPRGGDPENKGRFSALTRTKMDRLLIPIPQELPEEEEAAEPEQTVITATPTVKASSTITATPSVTATAPIQASAGQAITAGTKPIRAGQIVSTAGKEIVPLQAQIALEQTIYATLLADVAQPITPKRPKDYRKQTIRVLDHMGNPQPVFAVISNPSEQTGPEGGRVELTHDVVFTPSLDEAARVAGRAHAARTKEMVNHILDSGYNEVDVPIGTSNWTGYIDPDVVERVVVWKAYQGHLVDIDQNPDPLDQIAVQGPGEQFIERDYHYSELADMMNIPDEFFHVQLFRLTEGHDSVKGETTQVEAATRQGMERWITSGSYWAVPSRDIDIGNNVKLPIYHLDPEDAPYEEVGDWNPPGR